MKFSKSVLILSTAGLGLTLAYSQQSNSEAQQKALDILHQQLAGQDKAAPAAAPAVAKPAAGTPTREQLLADVERLHNEQKISDQQYEAFKKNINDQYAASASGSQTQSLTQQALAQKIQQLKAGPAAAASPQPVVTQTAPKAQPAVAAAAVASSNTEAQAKAQKALEAQLAQERASQAAKTPVKVAKAPAPKPAPAPATVAAAAAAPVVVAAPAPTRTVERTNVIPATAYSTLSAEQEAQAREALRQKIAEANSQTAQPKPAAKAAAVAAAPAPKPQPVVAAPVVAAPSRTAASAPAVAAVVAAPAPGSGGPPEAVAVLREYEIGIPPGTPELVRILRVKEAELDGIITPEEAARIPLPTRFYGPSPWAVAATSPKTEIPVATSNKEGLARLSELTYQYRANLISPADYHTQRAKIVATL